MSTLLAYEGLRHNGFIGLDDHAYVLHNAHVQAGLTLDGIEWAFTTLAVFNWHPITWLSHMLDCQLFGLDPLGHHATSLALHTLNAGLLLLFLWRATGAVGRSAWVVGAFALHPLHVESVAWIAERKDLLCALFWLIGLLAYLRWVRVPGWGRYLAVWFSFLLGLMAKPMAVTFPFALLLLDAWPLRRLERANLWERLREKLPLFVLAAGASGVTYWVQMSTGAMQDWGRSPLELRVANAAVSYVAYVVKLVVPLDLAVLYPFPTSVPAVRALVCAAALLAFSAFTLRWGWRLRYLAVGWLWYLGTLVPVIGLVQVGFQGMADRYTYLPSIGLFIALSWGAGALAERRRSA